MTEDAFEQLLDERNRLRADHEAWCEEVNGPTSAGEGSVEASYRDKVWLQLQDVEALIQDELDAELAAQGG